MTQVLTTCAISRLKPPRSNDEASNQHGTPVSMLAITRVRVKGGACPRSGLTTKSFSGVRSFPPFRTQKYQRSRTKLPPPSP